MQSDFFLNIPTGYFPVYFTQVQGKFVCCEDILLSGLPVFYFCKEI